MLVTARAAAAPTPALEKLIKAANKEKEMRFVLGGWGPQKLWDEIAALTNSMYGTNIKIIFVSGANLSRATAR